MSGMITRRPDLQIDLPYAGIEDLCRRYGVAELSIFGSALAGRDDFRPESDIDFLVVFKDPDLGPWMSKLTDMQDELATLLGRPVDLLPREGVERSENYIRRRHILNSAQVIYVA
jgi:uncharacterized protein